MAAGLDPLPVPWHAPPLPGLHTYLDGIKAYGHERITTPIGRRGKPVKKLRLIPAEGGVCVGGA